MSLLAALRSDGGAANGACNSAWIDILDTPAKDAA